MDVADESAQPKPFKRAVLTPSAVEVLKARYLAPLPGDGKQETPDDLFRRVAVAAAAAEKLSVRDGWAERFFDLISSLRFLPNSPTLMNAGKPGGQLAACFVLPLDDSLAGIFETLKGSALIHQSGGGTGFSFSRLRPKGSAVRSSRGVASGPVSFLRIFDTATETIKQGGTRRGANMGVLRVDHPDILEFIRVKREPGVITNFNLSVGITDQFMAALEEGKEFPLLSPGDRSEVGRVSALSIWKELVEGAWTSGDPGLVFLDRMNFFNPTPTVGRFESTNPCGEQPLLPFESCNLGSLNLAAYFVNSTELLDWELLAQDVGSSIRFLDNVIDANVFPVEACSHATLRTRKVGLGIMGFADLLLEAGIPYDSPRARELAEVCMGFVVRHARAASARLAQERGPFPAFEGSLWQRLGFPPLRNATVSTLAPTGTISLIAGCSSGIEPIFAPVIERAVLDGRKLREVHPAVSRVLRKKGFGGDLGSLPIAGQDEVLARYLGPAWSPAQGVSVDGHVQMQAAFQRHSDSAVSKTVNLPFDATEDDVSRAYRLAFRLGCKGITVFRDQSRPSQVLQRAKPEESGGVCDRECPEC